MQWQQQTGQLNPRPSGVGTAHQDEEAHQPIREDPILPREGKDFEELVIRLHMGDEGRELAYLRDPRDHRSVCYESTSW